MHANQLFALAALATTVACDPAELAGSSSAQGEGTFDLVMHGADSAAASEQDVSEASANTPSFDFEMGLDLPQLDIPTLEGPALERRLRGRRACMRYLHRVEAGIAGPAEAPVLSATMGPGDFPKPALAPRRAEALWQAQGRKPAAQPKPSELSVARCVRLADLPDPREEPAVCAYGPDSWADNPSNWFDMVVLVGVEEYDQEAALELLETEQGDDAFVELAVQLLTAELNASVGIEDPATQKLMDRGHAIAGLYQQQQGEIGDAAACEAPSCDALAELAAAIAELLAEWNEADCG